MYFGTLRKFDPVTGLGEIQPKQDGNAVCFQRDPIAWDRKIEPIIGQRLGGDVGQGGDRPPSALNLQTI